LIDHLHVLYQHRELLMIWTLREIKARYKQSVLGGAWAILQPVVLMLVYTVVFSFFIRLPSNGIPYPIFSYTALLAWTFFATSVTFAVPSLINNMSLVTKVYFPREILPLASIGAAFVDFLLATIPFIGLFIWYRTTVTATILWLPVLVAIQVALIIGVVLPSSAILVFVRDVRFVIPLAIQLWLYATPVIYPISVVPEQYRLLYALNPMVGLIDSYRRVVLQGSAPNPYYLGLSAAIGAALCLAGYIFFKRVEETFADHI
jgi:lipopolysaccharide transport system permease protein